MTQSDRPDVADHPVHEASGQAFSRREASALIAVGCNSLMVLGVLPILLGALADAHRLSNAQIGLAAMAEILTMGLSTGLMGLIRRPGALRWIGGGASLGLAAFDLICTHLAGSSLIAARCAAGAAEGVLLWITIGMIVRTATPERWAGVFFTAQTAAQLVLAILLAVWVFPKVGANGGFLALSAVALAGVIPALATPLGFGPMTRKSGEGGAPPPRGWVALLATLIFVAGGGAVGVYLEPLAHEAGLSAGVAGAALWTSLAGQVCGGALATFLAGRIGYFTIFVVGSVLSLGIWTLLGLRIPAWLFVADNIASGVVSLLIAPFIAPMTIEADPTRRAALQTGAAQLLGGALGPLLSSLVVSERDVRGVLWLGGGLVLAGLAIIGGLRATAAKPQ